VPTGRRSTPQWAFYHGPRGRKRAPASHGHAFVWLGHCYRTAADAPTFKLEGRTADRLTAAIRTLSSAQTSWYSFSCDPAQPLDARYRSSRLRYKAVPTAPGANSARFAPFGRSPGRRARPDKERWRGPSGASDALCLCLWGESGSDRPELRLRR
jgi:hypothetical protein